MPDRQAAALRDGRYNVWAKRNRALNALGAAAVFGCGKSRPKMRRCGSFLAAA